MGSIWRWWTETWHAPRRARWLYAAMAVAFGALAGVAAIRGDVLVAVFAALAVAVTVALAAVAPRLARLTEPSMKRGDTWKTN